MVNSQEACGFKFLHARLVAPRNWSEDEKKILILEIKLQIPEAEKSRYFFFLNLFSEKPN